MTLTFARAGIVGESLADGNYELSILADRVHTENYRLNGDGDGTAGGDYGFGAAAADQFFRFFGDSNGDRLVSTTDLALFRATLGKHEGQAGYRDYFDHDADGIIDSGMGYAQFLIRYRLRYLRPAGGRPTIAVVR